MAGWSIRHAGSPRSTDNLTAQEIVDGLQDGFYEPEDEVRGPGERAWKPMEQHPVFAAALADYEPPPPPEHPDESRLDMNPLIDVALVLLIFFILTTTYESIRKVLDMPNVSPKSETLTKFSSKAIKQATITIVARQDESTGKPVVKVEGETTAEEALEGAIQKWINQTGKRELYVDAEGVPWGTVVRILDAAKGVGIQKTLLKADKGSEAEE